MLKITKFYYFYWNYTKKSPKVRKSWFLKIRADSDDPRADLPLQNLCNSLGFSWSGQVSCVPWCTGTEFRDFSAIYGNSWNLHQITKFLEIAEKSMILSKFMEFSVFRAIHPPETLIFLRDYWCFRHPAIFMKFWLFNKKSKICEKIKNSIFSYFQRKFTFCGKWIAGHQKPLKWMSLHWF